jgi:micrococcal nuclease
VWRGTSSRRRPIRRLSLQNSFWLLLVAIVLIAMRLWPAEYRGASESQTARESTITTVKRAVDGDTLLLDDGIRVRLLGVDTPETKIPDQPPEPWGPEASEFTARHVTGRQVRLEFDRERFDRYGRTLAYVYVGDRLLNEELIREGLSAAQLQYPYRSDMKRRFVKAENEAREQHRGIWSAGSGISHQTGKSGRPGR